MDNFCEWAPWVFGILGAITGWLLRWWYHDGKISEFKERAEEKSNDLYHLNEAHTLLINDKNTKISTFQDEIVLKDKVINELNKEVNQLRHKLAPSKEATAQAKKKLSKVKEKSVKAIHTAKTEEVGQLDPNSLVSMIDKKAKDKAGTTEMIQPVVSLPSSTADKDDSRQANSSNQKEVPSKSKTSSKTQKYKKLLAKRDKHIQRLLSERDELKATLATLPKETIKERPIKITKTILIRESLDRKKLKKLIKQIPIKKTKSVLDKKVKKGKSRIISE